MSILKFRYYDSTIKLFTYSDKFNFPTNLQRLTVFFEMAQRLSDGKIQQFTGLKDKTGRDIYEGDFLTVREGQNPMYCIQSIKYLLTGHFSYGESLQECFEDMYICGNIFENSELLAEKALTK